MAHRTSDGPSRRELLRLWAAGVTGAACSGWLPTLAARAAAPAIRTKACIVLWMDGGPPHTDTFDPKPTGSESGIFKAIDTALTGVQISELYPQFAKRLKDAA